MIFLRTSSSFVKMRIGKSNGRSDPIRLDKPTDISKFKFGVYSIGPPILGYWLRVSVLSICKLNELLRIESSISSLSSGDSSPSYVAKGVSILFELTS